MRRKSTEREAKQNLDPFLDIITNVIGLLVIFAALVGLSVGGLESTMGFPVLKKPEEDSHFVDFCCFDSKIAHFDHEGIYYDEMIPDVQKALGDYAVWEQQVAYWNERSYRDDSMFVERVEDDGFNVTLVYGIREFGSGESFQDVCRNDSKFAAFLDTKDPDIDVIYFYVDGDSFSVFKKARQIARERGFRTGWRPFPSNRAYMCVSGEGTGADREIND